MEAQRGSRGTAVRFNFGARWRWVVSITPWPFCPGKRDEAPIVQYRKMGRPQGRSRRVRKISPSPDFDPPDRPDHPSPPPLD